MVAMFGCSKVATVAAQPASQLANAGNPGEATVGTLAPVTSVVRPVLKGLNAAVLLVDPPSSSCQPSRSATLAAVAGAPVPWRTQSSQPVGRAVKLAPAGALPGTPRSVNADAQSATVATVSTTRSGRRMNVMKTVGGGLPSRPSFGVAQPRSWLEATNNGMPAQGRAHRPLRVWPAPLDAGVAARGEPVAVARGWPGTASTGRAPDADAVPGVGPWLPPGWSGPRSCCRRQSSTFWRAPRGVGCWPVRSCPQALV